MEINDCIDITELKNKNKPVIATSIRCSSVCNLVVWELQNKSKIEAHDFKQEVSFIIAKKMDQLSDLLRDYQWFSPLIAIIDIKGLHEAEKKLKQLAGDQDWHRGRFIVQLANSTQNPTNSTKLKTPEELKDIWLSPIQIKQYTPQKIDNKRFQTLVIEKAYPNKTLGSRGFSYQFERYVDHVLQAIEYSHPEEIARKWEQEIVSDLNNLLNEDFFSGESNDAR